MSNYTPKVGDRVRRTFPGGSVMEGEVDFVLESGSAVDQNGNVLLSEYYPYETELLHRSVEFKDEVGKGYRHPSYPGYAIVKVDDSATDLNWLGNIGPISEGHWHSDDVVRVLVEKEGWVEHDIRSK